MLAILPKLAPWPFARAAAGVRKATRQAPLFGYALTSADPTPEFKVTDTYHNSTTEAGWSAFDADGNTSWYPHSQYANNYLQLECAKPRAIQSFYAFQDTTKGLHSGYLSTTIKILASNDGTNYTQLTSSTMTYAFDPVDTKVYVSQKVTFAAPKAYKFYRFYIAPTNHPYVALAGLVLQEPLAQPLQGLVAQYRFIDKEAINEINEAFATLNGTFSVADGKLTTASDISSYATMPKIIFDENEDFCIKLKHTFVATATENPIVGVFADGSVPASCAWILWRNGTSSGNKKINFGMNPSGSTGLRMASQIEVPDNQEVEIEVSRVNGTVYLFVDGSLQASQAFSLGNTPSPALPDIRTDVYAQVNQSPRSGYYNGGQKSALQIYKGKGGHTASYTKGYELETLGTPTYSDTDRDAIVANVAFRRDNRMNEVNDTYLSGFGPTVVRGRLSQGNGSSYMANINIDRFGDGDFTIECKVNLDSIGSSGAVLLGEWYRSDQSNTNNRWCVFIDQNRQLAFYVGKIDTTGTVLGLIGTVLTLGVDYHIVVERVNGVVSLLVNGNEVAAGAFTGQIPGFAPYIARTNSTSALHNWAGRMWEIRIAKKAMYNGVVKGVAVLPKVKRARPLYTTDEAKNIVLQYDFLTPKEEKLGVVPYFNDTAPSTSPVFQNNTLFARLSQSAKIFIPNENDWVNGDFTIETVLALNGMGQTVDTSNPLLCQWPGGSNHSWALFVRGTTRQIGFTVSTDGTANPGKTIWTGWLAKTLDFGRDYHIVVERVGSTFTVYVDGISAGSITSTLMTASTNEITNYFGEDNSRYTSLTLKRLRIARKALFNGNIVNAKRLPSVQRKAKPSVLVCGYQASDYPGRGSNPAWDCYGVAQASYYPNPGGSMSIGSTSDSLFRTRDGKTKRLVALFSITTNTRTELSVKDSSLPATDDMPVFDRLLQVNNTQVLDLGRAYMNNRDGLGATVYEVNSLLYPTMYEGLTLPYEFLPPVAEVTIGSANGVKDTGVTFKGYTDGLTDVPDVGSITNTLLIDVSIPRSCKLYKIRGIWTQSNNYLCIGLETLMTGGYAAIEAQYPNIADIPKITRNAFALYAGNDINFRSFNTATKINQTPASRNPYVQYYWTITAAELAAINANPTVLHYIA